MSEIIVFSSNDIKPLRKYFNILWLIILAITALLLWLVFKGEPIILKPQSEYVKSIVVILLLASVPGTFGWYTMKVKKIKKLEEKESKMHSYSKIWKVRSLIVFAVFMINVAAYIMILDESLAFMVAIAAFVFMYCRPSANTLKNELNDIPY